MTNNQNERSLLTESSNTPLYYLEIKNNQWGKYWHILQQIPVDFSRSFPEVMDIRTWLNDCVVLMENNFQESGIQ